jgi:hypothetical protein
VKIVTQSEHDQLTPPGLWSMTTTQPTRIGKSTVATCAGLSFAQDPQDDRVVAIDADTAFGTLSARVDPRAAGSLWDLAGPPTSKRCLILRIGHQGVVELVSY